MKYFWQINNSIAALYGAAVVGLAALLLHLWHDSLTAQSTARIISALAIMAFHTLAILAVGQYSSQLKLTKVVALLWHVGLWCFVWTVLAGVFSLPFYFSQLAPLGGQLLIAAWILLAVSAWLRR